MQKAQNTSKYECIIASSAACRFSVRIIRKCRDSYRTHGLHSLLKPSPRRIAVYKRPMQQSNAVHTLRTVADLGESENISHIINVIMSPPAHILCTVPVAIVAQGQKFATPRVVCYARLWYQFSFAQGLLHQYVSFRARTMSLTIAR